MISYAEEKRKEGEPSNKEVEKEEENGEAVEKKEETASQRGRHTGPPPKVVSKSKQVCMTAEDLYDRQRPA